jgi:isoleucyl-tRNA synthetase
MFRPVEPNVSFPKLEESILEFWRSENVFKRSLELREGAKEFVFYDGPPFATGLPHYGHLVAGILKDIVPRYWTMRGYYVERRFGWDCHGLPVENEVENELELGGKRDIEEYGVARFNEACRSIVLRYTAEWRKTVERLGRWVDFDDDYKTMEPAYMESVWWVFHQLWQKGLIYQGHSVQPYCPRCATPLSNFEANQAYQDVQDPSITIRLAIEGEPLSYFLVWTTTPWTLPSNLGVAVGPNIDYVKVADGGAFYWLAERRLAAYYKDTSTIEIVERAKGSALVGRRYEPPFDYFRTLSPATFVAVAADFVSTEDGSGIVHMAPAFGEDDQAVGRAQGWPTVLPLDAECRFTSEVPDHAGKFVKDADAAIIAQLKAKGLLVHRSTIVHAYPHCWRCDSPLIYRGIRSWFCRIDPIKERMIRNNRTINWVPDHIRDGRFGSWLENARDWNLSRNRYWGAPIPVWTSEDGEEIVCLGSVAELEKRSGVEVSDLHKHFVDDITIPSEKGKGVLRRVPEVLDCWFESGSMPYAQNHYPFENKERVEAGFPGDFIAEGLDQTRGWFYTLLILSTALFDRPPFKNVIVNGMLLAEDGKKMSKRLKNYPDPTYILDTYGADALRAYLINSPAVKAEALRFSEAGVKEILRTVMLPLWNAYSFFVTYATLDRWTPDAVAVPKTHRLDRWILSSLQTLIADVNEQMDRYNLYKVVPRLDGFIDDLTNWYIRRSRERFWGSDDTADKAAGYATLYDVLVTFSKVLAPVLPFVCEEIYRNLAAGRPNAPASVHLCDYPQSQSALRDAVLEKEMRLARTIVELGRALRAKHKLKTRQPLLDITVVARTEAERVLIRDMEDLICEELNVKAVSFTDREEELVHVAAKANFRTLGKRLGPRMKEVAKEIEGLDLATIRTIEEGGSVVVLGEPISADDIVITRQEIEGHVTETCDGVTVSLNTHLTPELVAEGNARELKNRIQTMRKDAGFAVSDRIRTRVVASPALVESFRTFEGYIKGETLTIDLQFNETPGDRASSMPGLTQSYEHVKEWEVAGEPVAIALSRS